MTQSSFLPGPNAEFESTPNEPPPEIPDLDWDLAESVSQPLAGPRHADELQDQQSFQFPDEPEPTRPVQRVAQRLIRRPLAWVDAPWTAPRVLRTITAAMFLITTFLISKNVVHWDLVGQTNTPTGGDMGAHVMAPAYLRDHLLGNFKISGWSPYWYNGFPIYRFYMVIPGLMIVLLNTVLPYGVAFKIVVISGVMTLPVCCWAFGRLAKFAFPIPELFALGATVFLLDESFAIYGGNLKSTMAGEFSFSIALSLAILGLGLFAHGLQTGKYRGRTAVVISLAMLSHGIVAIFVLLAVFLMWIVWMDRTRLLYGLTTLIPAGLLGAFWLLPFALGTPFMTDMKYGKRPEGANDSYWKMFFNLDVTFDRIIFVLAVVGFFGAIARRHLNGVWLGLTVIALAVFTRLAENSLPIIGLLWNPRVLPFFYLLRYLLMMVGIVEVGRGVTWLVSRARMGWQVTCERRDGHTGSAVASPTGLSWAIGGTATAFFALFVIGSMLLISFEQMPGGAMIGNRYTVRAGNINLYQKRRCDSPCVRDAQGDGWSRYNFTGYEEKNSYAEYRSLVLKMKELGADPNYGCGRALWENNGGNGAYGTTMSLMLLPHWTDGCIASSEGLFFEASGTTPYHFLAASAMSSKSSNPVRQLRYADNDPALGVAYLQKLGIRYYMAWTDLAIAKAETQAGLTELAQVGPWHIYEVANSEIVEPLTVQPVVVAPRSGDKRERWLELGTSWFQHPDEWPAMPAADGPVEWQRIEVAADIERREGAVDDRNRKVDIVVPRQLVVASPLPATAVSNVVLGNETVDFDVDQIGVPVLVKVSYFPNWQVSGADGPYRIAPNQMVVIPRSNHVHMEFTRSTSDYAAYMLSFLGLILLFVFKRLVPIHYRTKLLANDSNAVAFLPVDGAQTLPTAEEISWLPPVDHDSWSNQDSKSGFDDGVDETPR